jgi:hypothetical protein
MTEVEPFAAFLSRVAAAQPEQYCEAIRAAAARHNLSAERVEKEFEKMKSYILQYYAGVTPVRSFLDGAGQPVDDLLFDQQPPYLLEPCASRAELDGRMVL